MNVYQAVEHFHDEVGLNLLLDSMFGEEGADGGFPLPDTSDGGHQALVFDEFGLWFITQSPSGVTAQDRLRYFPFDVVTSCTLRQTEGARRVYEGGETSYDQRMAAVLRSTALDMGIAESAFRFDGAEIAGFISNESFYPEIVGDLFHIVRHCASYGVPVELMGAPSPIMAGAGAR